MVSRYAHIALAGGSIHYLNSELGGPDPPEPPHRKFANVFVLDYNSE